MFIVGVLLAGPALATAFSKAAQRRLRPFGVAPRLSADNIAANPKRTSTTINALVIGLFLVTLVTIAGTSFKKTAVEKVNELSSADFLIGANAGPSRRAPRPDRGARWGRPRWPVSGRSRSDIDDHPDAITASDPFEPRGGGYLAPRQGRSRIWATAWR